MNIPSKISNDSFQLLWEEIVKEGIKTKRTVRINRAITIFSQIFFAIAIMLFGWVVLYFLFENDSKALLIKDIGSNIIQFIPSDIPNIVKVIICLILTLIIPAVCCLLVRLIFSLLSAKYKNDDIGKDGLVGAKAIEKAVNELKKERKHYDITWDLPEHWSYNLIFSIFFLLPLLIQLYLLADKTNAEGILSFVLMGVLFAGLGGLILLLPIAGLKAISNFLCNQTCVFLKNSKEKEYDYAIEVLSKYIHSTEQEIKTKEEEHNRKKQEEEIIKKKEKLQKDMLEGQKLYEEATSADPVNDKLMSKAAKLGHPGACLYLGKNLLTDWLSDMYTAEEKKEIAENAAKHFDVARQFAEITKADFKTESTFLWLFARIQYESNTKAQWKEILNSLRKIQKAGDLPEGYSEMLEIAIKTAVNVIDSIKDQPVQETSSYNEPHRKLECKFRNGAICTKNSNSAIIYHCNYVNDPAICPTARQGGLEYR